MSKRICKKCGSVNVRTTKYSNGGKCYVCDDCCVVGISDAFPEYTIFHKITTSPEVLAEKSVYAHECCRIPDGITSPFIDTIFWFEDEKGDTWDERFDSAWEKALAATVARLKEVCDV